MLSKGILTLTRSSTIIIVAKVLDCLSPFPKELGVSDLSYTITLLLSKLVLI
jgi:hypothetical protein